ncbi:unnamed protein product [Caenorhabditis sp. 36 PRJEB53466]|nr:unnamed protein product [Caenorhabditis sp. 36 PRJEB53466]
MEKDWLLSALLTDDLVEKIRERTSQSSSINVPSNTLEDELLSISSGSRFNDDFNFRQLEVEVPREQFRLVSKPLPCSNGVRRLALFANQFRLTCSEVSVHQYNVQFEPDIPSKKLNRKIMNILQEQVDFGAPLAFDGWHTIYSIKKIDVDKVNRMNINVAGMVNTKESPNEFSVFLTYMDKFQLDTRVRSQQEDDAPKRRMMHAIDTILRQTSSNRFHAVLQSFFSITPHNLQGHGLGWGTVNLGLGREVCYGFYQNIVETFDVLTMNLDVATTTFYRPISVVEFLAEVLGVPLATVIDGRPLSDVQKKRFSKEIAGLKVETRYRGTPRRFRVARCTWKPMESIHLSLPSRGQGMNALTLIDYYRIRYDVDLQYRHLPCLEVGRTHDCVLPLELCFIVSGQRCIKKLNEQQIANLIKATSRNASERKEAVMKLRNRIDLDEDPYGTQFGLSVNAEMMKIEGRVLLPPKLVYSSPMTRQQDCVTTPNNGTWDMRGKNFYSGIQISKWALVSFASSSIVSPNNIRTFTASLQKVANEIGMPFLINHCFCRYSEADQASRILDYLHEEHPDLQLIICVVPGKSAIYGDVKRKGDSLGLTTQCVRSHNVIKVSPHTLSNLCMKINSKLGGVNVVISARPQSITHEPVLFIGCLLSRNSSGSVSDSVSSLAHIDSSISCLVGSMDGHPTRFYPIFRTQPRNSNVIVDMADMVREAIVNFRGATGFKPHKIVVYRSGITDETVEEILQTELRGVREACSAIEQNYQPGITFIGLDVTHHTRLFAADDIDKVGSSQNVPAGTIVETGITVNNLFEFYLVSHAGIQGTSRPTKYVVMWDDNQMPPEDVHDMTYQLCHTQSRCTRSVSIPSPVYYAKLVAQRAKILMAQENFSLENFREISRRFEGMLFT